MGASITSNRRRHDHDPHCISPPWSAVPVDDCRNCMRAREIRQMLILDLRAVYADSDDTTATVIEEVLTLIEGIGVLSGGGIEPDVNDAAWRYRLR